MYGVSLQAIDAAVGGSFGALDGQEAREAIYPPPKYLTPEKTLIAAILRDAIACLAGQRPFGGEKERIYRETVNWVQDRRDWVFSFGYCCTALNLDPDYIRRLIRAEFDIGSDEAYPPDDSRRTPRGTMRVRVPDDDGHSHPYVSAYHCKECRRRFDRARRGTPPTRWRNTKRAVG